MDTGREKQTNMAAGWFQKALLLRTVRTVLESEAEMNGFRELQPYHTADAGLFHDDLEIAGDKKLSLCSENTGLVQKNDLYGQDLPLKFFYSKSHYYREKLHPDHALAMHRFHIEVLGDTAPCADAQMLALVKSAMDRLGLTVGIELYAVGCKECSQHTKAAETDAGFLCKACTKHLAGLKANLDSIGVGYVCRPAPVAGRENYTGAAYSLFSQAWEGKTQIGSGGRYRDLSGEQPERVWLSLDMDKIAGIMQALKTEVPAGEACELFIASSGEPAGQKAFMLADMLHRCGIPVDFELCGRGLEAQMEYAEKAGARFIMTLSDTELQTGQAKLQNNKTGETYMISIGNGFMDDYISHTVSIPDLSF